MHGLGLTTLPPFFRFTFLMVTDAVRSQVASKWQDSFNRLNRNAPGISGLMEYSEVIMGLMLLAFSARLIGSSSGVVHLCQVLVSQEYQTEHNSEIACAMCFLVS